jgi:hypothetical protein
MKNKYFTPDIEDFCIGYEYETIYLKSVWTKESLRIMDAGWFFESYENDAVPTEFRVPYLTKEQIEAEGWIDDTLCYQTPELFVGLQNSQTWRKLVYKFSDNVLQIVEVDDYYIYSGQCKDINTFRKIIKLLEI